MIKYTPNDEIDASNAIRQQLAAAQLHIERLLTWQKKAAPLIQHSDGCAWITPLPTGEGFWGCDCGADELVLDGEPILSPKPNLSALESKRRRIADACASWVEATKKKATIKRHGFGAFGEHESYYELDPDLFAELIIKECIESFEQEFLSRSDD